MNETRWKHDSWCCLFPVSQWFSGTRTTSGGMEKFLAWVQRERERDAWVESDFQVEVHLNIFDSVLWIHKHTRRQTHTLYTVFTHTHTHTHTHKHTHTYTQTHTQESDVWLWEYTCVCVSVCLSLYTVYLCLSVCLSVYLSICLSVYLSWHVYLELFSSKLIWNQKMILSDSYH